MKARIAGAIRATRTATALQPQIRVWRRLILQCHGMFDPFEDVEHGQRDLAGYCGYTPAPPTPPPCNNNSTDSQFLPLTTALPSP